MKKALTLFVCCVFMMALHAQIVDWQWARASSGAGLQQGYSIATDPSGNVFFTGGFLGAEFTYGDSFLLGSSNAAVSYLMKCNSEGQVIWLKKIASRGALELSYVATDTSGNAYCAGYATDTLMIGDSLFIPAINTTPAYLVKYDSNGTMLWASQVNGAGYMYLMGIATDVAGNAYITGQYAGASLSFGNVTITQSNPTNVSMFLAKYRASGQVAWVKTNGPLSPSGVVGAAVATDKAGNVYSTGSFNQTADFGPYTLTSYGGLNSAIYLVKYDTAGNILWATSTGGNGEALTYSITTDEQGNAYLTGCFRNDTICLGTNATDTLINQTATDPTQETLLVAKYNSSGSLVWAKCAGGTSFNQGFTIAADTNGNIFVTGSYSPGKTFTFDSVAIALPNSNRGLLFILTLDTAGNLLCNTTLASQANRIGLCADNKGSAYLTNYFNQNNLVVGTDTLKLTGSDNAFLAKFSCASSPAGIQTVEENGATLLLYPNPFSNQATVQYVVPPNSKNGALVIYDMLGRQQSAYRLNGAGGEITIDGSKLSSGVYLYSLVVDGRVVDTKRMVVE